LRWAWMQWQGSMTKTHCECYWAASGTAVFAQ
jgi:hypothetical protein